MLPLDDPLWMKLDDVHSIGSAGPELAKLAKQWDKQAARELFWDYLSHAEGLYGATYPAIPHLLRMAETGSDPEQRREIASFLGMVALNAQESEPPRPDGVDENITLPGLPMTLEGWDRTRDPYRRMVELLEAPEHNAYPGGQDDLQRYREYLDIPPLDADDLVKIREIYADFFAALPRIRELARQVFLQGRDPDFPGRYMLSAIAACDGYVGLARQLEYGDEGGFGCSECSASYDYLRFGDRFACYAAAPTSPNQSWGDSPSDNDFEEGAPNRADGFITPWPAEKAHPDPKLNALLVLAAQSADADPRPAQLLGALLGAYRCNACGSETPVK